MACYEIEVTKSGLIPAVVYAGPEGAVGQTMKFTFSDDWDGLTKYIQFFTLRGQEIIVPYAEEDTEIFIPAEVSMWGGPSRFTVKGIVLDEFGYISTSLAVTGTIYTTYTAGHNPRLTGKITPNTVELYLAQAAREMERQLAAAKESGMFDGKDGEDGKSFGFGDTFVITETLSPSSPAYVNISTSGPDTAKSFAFYFGIPKGDPGAPATPIPGGIKVLGHYASLSALQLAVPSPEVGDAYSVGSSTPYTMYIFDGVTHAWANYGTIAEGGGGSVVDTAMSGSSTNAVQNKVIKEYVDDLIGDVDTAIAAINAIIGG